MLSTTALAVTAATLVAGCTISSTVGGLVTISGRDVDGEAVPFEGELLLDDQSCELARLTTPAGSTTDRWVVWPTGAELYTNERDAGSAGYLEGAVIDGERFVNGDRIRGTGYVVGLEALPGEGRRSGGMYAERGRYCDAHHRGVLVIVDVEHV
ncbi:MAG: hypothetical protein PGN11_00220 [Quadrisphaera sp.]